jgi:hypothetical protein
MDQWVEVKGEWKEELDVEIFPRFTSLPEAKRQGSTSRAESGRNPIRVVFNIASSQLTKQQLMFSQTTH